MKIKSIDSNENKKKKEEKQKFIFKKAIKGLKNKIKKMFFTRKKVLKRLLAEQFYSYYFKNALQKEKAIVENYHMNPKKLSEFSFTPRTLNRTYFTEMFTIKSFKTDFFEYLEQHFLGNYILKIEKKIANFVEVKIKNQLYENPNDDKKLEYVCKQIKNNPKWKIPWTIREATFALKEFLTDFYWVLILVIF